MAHGALRAADPRPSTARHTSLSTPVSDDVVIACPLCGDSRSTRVETIPNHRIWDGLTSGLGARFSPSVLTRYSGVPQVHLQECQACGLQFFDRLEPGDAEFYSQLTSTVACYYSSEKWDFRAALDYVGSGQKTLDIACGAGEFVARAMAAGALARGVDTNPSAVATARQRGLTVDCMPLDAFAAQCGETFDVVTAFQVIEHIPAVGPFMAAATQCLKPGGTLIVTVPNRLRRFRDTFEPLDAPPHHLSRWTSAQLRQLAALSGLVVTAIRYEHAGMHDCRALVRQAIAQRLRWRADSIAMRALGRLLCGDLTYRIYAAAGLLDRWRFWRMSVMAVLRKVS